MGDHIGDLRVERPALFVQAPELVVVLRERTIASAHSLPGGVDVDVEPDDRGALLQQRARFGDGDGLFTRYLSRLSLLL